MDIILFGGAFNPVHIEHVALARAAVQKIKPEKLIVIPTAVSPHKFGRVTAENEDRLNMCRAAFADIPSVEVSDFEIANGGVSYSYITCEHFASLYPEARLFFLMGADQLASFPGWKNPSRILSKAVLLAGERRGAPDFALAKSSVEDMFSVRVESVGYAGSAVDSTRVRTLAALGEDFSAYVLPRVGQYIKERGLYLRPDLLNVKSFEKPSRWQHSVRVAVMCAQNAQRAGLGERDAVTMAALHDVSKNLPADSPLLSGFVPPPNVPSPVMHQYSGAYVAQNHFGVNDERLLSAIRFHTSGRPGMTKPEMLLFLCDMLEEGRSFPGVEKLRALFKVDLVRCMYAALEHQLNYLNGTGGQIYPLTINAYLYLKEFLT